MDYQIITANLLSPPILFFFLGMVASALQVSLTVPNPIPKFLSLYLLMVIGFHGGVEFAKSPINLTTALPLLIGIIASFVVPLYAFFILRMKLNVYDAAATAASYGSVGGITFISAIDFLQTLHIPFGGHMVATLALMESPAIVVGLLLAYYYGDKKRRVKDTSFLHDAFLNGAVFLILGSFFIGWITGDYGLNALRPFTQDIFKGMLCFFMLDMGIVSIRRIGDLKSKGIFVILFSIIMPLINACIAIVISYMLGFSVGDSLLFTILLSSASYIGVPSAMRLALPEANPGVYTPMALGITLPFNIIVGLPMYLYFIKMVVG